MQSRRVFSTILMALFSLSALAISARSQNKVPVIRGSGTVREQRITTRTVRPKALAQSTLREMTRLVGVGTEPGETYFELSSRHPFEADRGFLRYQCVRGLDGELNRAVINYGVGCSARGVEVVIRPATANSQYVIDCTVNTNSTREFTIQGPNNFEQKLRPQVVNGDQHLVFVFLATGTESSTFRTWVIDQFDFYFCRATTLK